MRTAFQLLSFASVLLLFCSFYSCDFIYKDYSPNDYPEAVITYQNRITVVSPSFADEFRRGSEINIAWSSFGTINKVDIELFKKSQQIRIIKSSSDNTGQLKWMIPSDIPNSVQYSLRISNSENKSEFAISDRFAVID